MRAPIASARARLGPMPVLSLIRFPLVALAAAVSLVLLIGPGASRAAASGSSSPAFDQYVDGDPLADGSTPVHQGAGSGRRHLPRATARAIARHGGADTQALTNLAATGAQSATAPPASPASPTAAERSAGKRHAARSAARARRGHTTSTPALRTAGLSTQASATGDANVSWPALVLGFLAITATALVAARRRVR